MKIITDLKEWQDIRKRFHATSIGFVPTMGNLHAGHLSLCERARQENKMTVVSIFVNPTQFNETRDYVSYPRTIVADSKLLNVDYLLVPDESAIYPDNYQIQVIETALSLELEGWYRPGHFTGMLTIVLKLLNLVQASNAYFGEKDYQQLLLIKKMAQALFHPTKIIACATVRDHDGLALSSRNSRLNPAQREKAKLFPQLLHSPLSVEEIIKSLCSHGFKVDYIAEKWQRRLGAVWLDNVRLIDNVRVTRS